jgi:hypothetical protein
MTEATSSTLLRLHLRPRALLIAGLVVAVSACGGGGEEASTEVSLPPQIDLPTVATVTEVDSELSFDQNASISPSGRARVGHDERGWCLEDASGVQCLQALSEESGGDAIRWRDDEMAVAVTFSHQDPISILDFAAGTVVETDLDHHRLLDWSPDGSELLAVVADKPDEIRLLDPVTLDDRPFTSFEGQWIPQLRWIGDDLIWGSYANRSPEVFVLDGEGKTTPIKGGIGEQEFLSFSADGRFALTEDDAVAHGEGEDGDPVLFVFDRTTTQSSGLILPPGVTSLNLASGQLSADGTKVLLLTEGGDVPELFVGRLDPRHLSVDTWITIEGWPAEEGFEPAAYSSNGALRWDGGPTAWVISEQGTLLEVALS